MIFKVKDSNGSHSLNEETLLQLIFKSILDEKKEKERIGNNDLVSLLINHLLITKTFAAYKLVDLIKLAFDTGYYYAMFLQKNEVEIIEKKDI